MTSEERSEEAAMAEEHAANHHESADQTRYAARFVAVLEKATGLGSKGEGSSSSSSSNGGSNGGSSSGGASGGRGGSRIGLNGDDDSDDDDDDPLAGMAGMLKQRRAARQEANDKASNSAYVPLDPTDWRMKSMGGGP